MHRGLFFPTEQNRLPPYLDDLAPVMGDKKHGGVRSELIITYGRVEG